jgi:hypothetical protein
LLQTPWLTHPRVVLDASVWELQKEKKRQELFFGAEREGHLFLVS